MEYYNDILCISAAELIDGIISPESYKKYCIRKKINKVRRSCRATPALIEVKSLPSRILEAVKAKYGPLDSAASKYTIHGAYHVDDEARSFYKNHLLPDGKHLQEKFIDEYTINASVLKAIKFLLTDRDTFVKSKGGIPKRKWDWISSLVNSVQQEIQHTLPANPRRLKLKLEEFEKEGYVSLLSGKLRNKNTEKVPEQAKIWMLTRWADNVKKVATINQLFQEYNEKAESMPGWSKIKSDNTVKNFLYSPEIQPLWFAHRHGSLADKEKYSYMHKTILPTMRDSLWYSDGTKLNYYYQYSGPDGKPQIGTLQVYEVMDVYSEALLGYHISKHEDYEAQFRAYKMAFQTSKYKPYQITYDNQGGHKKLENSDLLGRLAHLSIKTAPYNGRSKTIESVFGRFQSQVLKKDWFFTGQNITATSLESKANLEFIMSNRQNLPSEQEIREAYALRREEWNNMKHPKTGVARIEMYRSSVNPQAKKVDLLDIVDLFWLTREHPVTCTAWGISFKEKNVKYDYMVADADRRPDLDWLQKHIDKKFVIKYDPEDMSMIFLYDKTASGLRFNNIATTKIAIHRGKQEQEDWEAQYIKDIELKNKAARIDRYEKMTAMQKEEGTSLDDYGFRTPALLGIQTSSAAKRAIKKNSSVGIGNTQKVTSNTVIFDNAELEEFDPYEYARKSM